jgi:DDE family transposase/uncharacterized protein DUF4372
MSSSPTRRNYTILAQVCKLIPSHLTDKIARRHGVDKQARTFSPWSHVVSLIYAQLVHAMSLNDVCDALKHHAAKLFDIRLATPPAKNTLSHANRNRNAAMAEDLFWETFSHLTNSFPRFGGRTFKGMPRRFKRTINVVDSTTIQLVHNCIDWARHRRKKAAAKLHLSLNLQSYLPRFVLVDSARHSDPKKAWQLCAPMGRGEIVVFDKAYVDFSHLNDLNERGVFWVTRAKEDMQFRCVKRLQKKRQGRIIRDDLVILKIASTRKKYPSMFRRVHALVEVNGKDQEMIFITNNLDWAASSIAELYRCRWSVETFFKELKQTLQLCDFLGHNRNAILWQIWTALLLNILLRFLAFSNSWNAGFKRLFCILRSCVWDTFSIIKLLASCGTARGTPRHVATAHHAYLPGFSPFEEN